MEEMRRLQEASPEPKPWPDKIASSAGFLREKAQAFKVWTFFIGIDMREANIFIINSLFP